MVVVTPSKQETLLENTAASVTVIDRKEIESQAATTVPEVLRNVTGVDFVGTGSRGDDADLRMRGSDRDQVLVLIDGVPINSVTDHRPLFLESIPLDHVEKIEIVRGSQSVLYGSDAVGGVIHIITQKKTGELRASAALEAGNLGTFREVLGVSGSPGKNDFSAAFSRTDQRGRFDRDRFGEFALSGNFGRPILPELKLEAGANYFRTDQELFYEFLTSFDPSTGTLTVFIDPDSNRNLHRDIVSAHTSLKGTPLSRWSVELLYGLLVDLSRLQNSATGDAAPAGLAPGTQDFSGRGFQNTVDLRNFVALHESSLVSTHFTLGFEFQDERFHFTDPPTTFPGPGQQGDRQNFAPYFKQDFLLWDESLILSGGARFDHNTTFGDEWSPRGSILYKLKKTGTTFRGSYGEGFHGPTVLEFFTQVLLRELGDPRFQAVRLQSELSQSYEAGIGQEIGRWGEVGATFFYADYDRLFDELQFIQDAYAAGVEMSLKFQPFDRFSFGGNYTFQRARNETGGIPLANRPAHHGNIFIQGNPVPRLSLRADVNLVGRRPVPNTISTSAGDLNFIFTDPNGNMSAGGTLNRYVKVDLAASYEILEDRRLLKNWKASFKIENLLDDSYQEKFGFPAPGITFLAGSQATF